MKLKEIVEICYGKNQKHVEVNNSEIPILGTGGIIGYSSKPLYSSESVLIGRKGTIGMPFYVKKPFWTIDTLFYTKINKNIVIPKYLYYLLCTIGLSKYSEGAAVPSLTTKTLYEIDLSIHPKIEQQHIVDTIGSVDDLIENYQKQIEKIHQICNKKIDYINDSLLLDDLSKVAEFDKGIEIGSKNYFDKKNDGFINYIRVGDLIAKSNTFIDSNIKSKTASFCDALIAFDGAPGRISYGLNGAYSSGIYKVIPRDNSFRGLIYFELLSTLNQKIIKDYSQGTTILHASKSIPYLKYAQCSDEDIRMFNYYYNILVTIKNKISTLNNIKNILLDKYFTNQQ